MMQLTVSRLLFSHKWRFINIPASYPREISTVAKLDQSTLGLCVLCYTPADYHSVLVPIIITC